MKYCGLISGGKDSIFNLHKCNSFGHELVCLANLAPASSLSVELDSFTFQTVGHNVVDLIAECLGKELLRESIEKGSSTNMALHYFEAKNDGMTNNEIEITEEDKRQHLDSTERMEDEVEKLYTLLQKVKIKYPDVEAVAVGAILSTYQRSRVENVCARLNLHVLSYLWQYNEIELVQEMIDWQLEAIFIKISSMGLKTRKHLGKTLADNYSDLLSLNKEYEVHVAGEGGEYETLVLDCPLFEKKRIVVDESEIILLSDDYFAPVAVYQINKVHLEAKEKLIKEEVEIERIQRCCPEKKVWQTYRMEKKETDTKFVSFKNRIHHGQAYYGSGNGNGNESKGEIKDLQEDAAFEGKIDNNSRVVQQLIPSKGTVKINFRRPHRCFQQGNQLFISGLSGAYKSGVSYLTKKLSPIVQVLEELKSILETCYSSTLNDCVFIHLYLQDMNEFQEVNQDYCHYFPILHPPSRSCVQVNLPDGIAIMMDAWILLDSYQEMISCTYSYINLSSEDIQSENEVNSKKMIHDKSKDDEENVIQKTFSEDKIQDKRKKTILNVRDKDYNRKNRAVLHVRSISSWAPVCIGPYSQANTLKKALTFVAGQIPLIPSTMEILSSLEPFTNHISLAVQNLLAILYHNTLEGGKAIPISLLIYVNNDFLVTSKEEKRDSPNSWTPNEVKEMVISEIKLQYQELIQRDQYFQNYEKNIAKEAHRERNLQHVAYEEEVYSSEYDNDSCSSLNTYSSIESLFERFFFDEDNEDKQVTNSQDESYISKKISDFVASCCVVGIPALPRNAKIELESVAMSLNALKRFSGSPDLQFSSSCYTSQTQKSSTDNLLPQLISAKVDSSSSSSSSDRKSRFPSSCLPHPFHSHLFPSTNFLLNGNTNNLVFLNNQNQNRKNEISNITIQTSTFNIPYILNFSYITLGLKLKDRTITPTLKTDVVEPFSKYEERSDSISEINLDVDMIALGNAFRLELLHLIQSVCKLQFAHVMSFRIHYNRNLIDETTMKTLTEEYILLSSEIQDTAVCSSNNTHHYLKTAITYVPVEALEASPDSISLFTIQVIAFDLEKLSTEIWIHR